MSEIIHGDCRIEMAKMEPNSVDSIVCDPPYGLEFMGKGWDNGVPGVPFWVEALRVLKPGGYLLAFGGTRTYHRLTCAIEDAGFEIRDSINWLYAQGFPKSHDVAKGIDKAAGATDRRVVVGVGNAGLTAGSIANFAGSLTAPATPEAAQWEGWGTALKPAHEPVVVARKPLEGTVAQNVLTYGTGALNIDGSRVGSEGGTIGVNFPPSASGGAAINTYNDGLSGGGQVSLAKGRWPANIILSHTAECGDDCAEGCPVAALDEQSGHLAGGAYLKTSNLSAAAFYEGGWKPQQREERTNLSSGGASRYFTNLEADPPFLYAAKAGKKERNAGLGALPEVRSADRVKDDGAGGENPRNRSNTPKQNHHPTVKPLAVMRWLVKLVTPPSGVVLDPFCGSGTTLVAATLEGFDSIGIEMTDEYLPIIEARVAWAVAEQEGKLL